MILGIIGPLPFVAGRGNLFSPTGISKTRKNSWARHKIMCANDSLEDTGVEPIDLSIEMSFFAPWTFNPSSSLAMLEAFAESRLPMPVILGGSPLGRGALTLFVVEAVDAKMEKWNATTLVVLHVTVKLIEYSLPASPLMSFLSNPVGAVSGAASRVISSIGMPGPIGGAAVSGLGLGSNPNILAGGH